MCNFFHLKFYANILRSPETGVWYWMSIGIGHENKIESSWDQSVVCWNKHNEIYKQTYILLIWFLCIMHHSLEMELDNAIILWYHVINKFNWSKMCILFNMEWIANALCFIPFGVSRGGGVKWHHIFITISKCQHFWQLNYNINRFFMMKILRIQPNSQKYILKKKLTLALFPALFHIFKWMRCTLKFIGEM